jgi:hypothetical protein
MTVKLHENKPSFIISLKSHELSIPYEDSFNDSFPEPKSILTYMLSIKMIRNYDFELNSTEFAELHTIVDDIEEKMIEKLLIFLS